MTKVWSTNQIPWKDLKYMLMLILHVDGIRLILEMPTTSIQELDLWFFMLAVPFIGKASFKLRLHFLWPKLSTLHYPKLWGRQFPWWISWRKSTSIFPLYLPKPKFVIKVWEDNQSCIAMANNPKFSPWRKHIALKYNTFWKHVITQLNPDGFIVIDYCSTDDQIADIFTKPVRDDKFFRLQNLLLNW